MVSIIIPALNEESYLPRLLESIRAQDYPDYEIIVADNDSRDRTRSVARAHGARVVRGGVPGVARNRGAAAARGEYLLFVDADTVLPEGFISRIMARFQKDFIDICVPWIRPIDGTNPIYNTIFQFSNTFFKLMEVIQPQGLGICILTTKRLHDRIGGFSEKVRVSEDFDYINRASLVGRFRVYPHVYVYHSVRRYKAEGVGSLVQKQFKSGFIYLFTGRAYDTENYEFGTFSRYVRDERNGKRAEPDGAAARQGRLESKRSAERVSPYGAEVKKLLDSFDRQSRRLRHQIEKIEGDGGEKPAGKAASRTTASRTTASRKTASRKAASGRRPAGGRQRRPG